MCKISQILLHAHRVKKQCRECHVLPVVYTCIPNNGVTGTMNRHDSEEVETYEIEVQPAESGEKRRRIEHMQGLSSDELSDFANVPHIPFVENSRLPAKIDRRGYPRLIHIEHFTKETNTDDLTMADFVAAILFHHNPHTLTAFFDERRYPKFGFAERNPSKAQDFAIERERKKNGLVCGYGAGYLFEKYVYLVEADGRWVPESFKEYLASTIMDKALIEQMAEKTGKDLLCGKVWIEGHGSIIRIDGTI
ncbi:hypothetical protein JMJ35_008450 [Cladonia borealis]|uniref:Uncharacterized protein n=1 Tax=Cladonia borealis TaxID=184061 RepID=A0AA39QVF1_9LECA|nr:hypothetical protein JMJ35_008450 [Cladonia borealis]